MLNKEVVLSYAKRIVEFEYSAGECFIDYFLDGNVKPVSWAFWLLGKGYATRANIAINIIRANFGRCTDTELMFCVNSSPLVNDPHVHPKDIDYNFGEMYGGWYPSRIGSEQLHFDDCCLWAEFLISTDRYMKPFEDFLLNFESGGEY